MATITQTQLQDIFNKADASGQKLDRAQIVQGLVDRGHIIEGLNDPPPQKKPGFFSKLKERNAQAFGAGYGVVSAMLNPAQTAASDSAAGRLLRGEQGVGRTALQVAGQGAGAIGDVVGAGIGLVGKGISALTPDVIEKPIVDTTKKIGVGILNTPVGQQALKAIESGAETWQSFKESNPVVAKDVEAIVNIGSLVPIGRVSQAGKKALSPLDDAAKGLGKAARESAEASVSRTLNPTTQATKAATQKIAGELVDRPLSETLSVTRKGMQTKAAAAAEVAGEAIEGAGKLTGNTKTSELINYLQSQKQQFMAGGKAISREGVESIDEVTRIIAQYGDEIPNETLRDIRRIFDSEFYQGTKNIAKSTTETSTLNFKKEAANRIRSILGEKFPDIAKLNKEYTFWANLDNILGKTVSRRTGQKGALKAVATVGGAVAGQGVAGSITGAIAFRTVASLVDSPVWGFVSAKVKDRISKALISGDLSAIGKILGSIPGISAVQSLKE